MNGIECVWGTEAGQGNAEVLADISHWWAYDEAKMEAFLEAANA